MDMHISGSGRVVSGEYDKIRISGSGSLQGFVRCGSFHASGSCRGEEIECREEFQVSGSSSFDKSVRAGSFGVSGAASFGGDMIVKTKLKCSGAVKCEGSIKCGTLVVSGKASVRGDVEAETVEVSGRLNCGGLLNAEEITIRYDVGMEIGSIGGSKIVIYQEGRKRKHIRLPLLSSFVGAGGTVRVGSSIEGDEIALEGVKAQRVSGRVVAIGKDCEIDLVQYSEQIEIAPEAKVGKTEKL